MTIRESSMSRFMGALRRRRMLSTAGLYVVGAWLVMQAADVFFPGWGIPDAAINVLLLAAILGFPVALVFGWFFNITTSGIMRTMPVGPDGVGGPRPLEGKDYLVLGALVLAAGVIVSYAAINVVAMQESRPALLEKLPNSIAVLPFSNDSDDPANELFGVGVSEEILNRLGEFEGLTVIGRTSSFAFKDKDFSVPQITSLLGVRYLLHGSVRKQGNRLRISAWLLDENGLQVWSDSFDRTLEDVFAIQAEIADIVATTVYPQVASAAGSGPRPVYAAFEHYLRGRELLHLRDDDGALRELEQAIEIDPGFAEAQAEFAIALLLGIPTDAETERAQRAIDAALTLRSDLPRALAAQGLLLLNDNESARAESVLRHVVALEPNMSDALLWLALSLDVQGRQDEYLEVLERAARIDPLHPAIAVYVSNELARRGDTERANAILLRLVEVTPRAEPAYRGLEENYLRDGRIVEAIEIQKRGALNRAVSSYFRLAERYAMLGDWDAAAYWLERSQRELPDFFSPYFDAAIPSWQGRYDEAARIFKQVLATHADDPMDLNPTLLHLLGAVQGRSGDHAGTIATLEPVLDPGLSPLKQSLVATNAAQALAWAYLQTGREDKAAPFLDRLDRDLRELDEQGALNAAEIMEGYLYALNTLMMGRHELALDRLAQAFEGGWRTYYISHHDPRWDEVRDDPRFVELMARVKADVDAQRAEMQRIDAKDDFIVRLDEVMGTPKGRR
jgi:TolB-like protein/predicted Zn-dependent protease